jgi:dTDP-4-dehydrorhamnose reductase
MRLLITGASGLLGINLAMEAMRAHEVIGVDRGKLKSAPFEVIKADLFHSDALDSVLDSARPDALVNCAALANLEESEEHPEHARILNVEMPGQLAHACARRNISFIHLSTDAVFDGTKAGSYMEDDEPNPQGVYAQSKLDGERAVQQANPQAIIARVNFFGWSLTNRRSLGEFFVNNLSAEKTCQWFHRCHLLPNACQPHCPPPSAYARKKTERLISRCGCSTHE